LVVALELLPEALEVESLFPMAEAAHLPEEPAVV
jgi:hypothetical protein